MQTHRSVLVAICLLPGCAHRPMQHRAAADPATVALHASAWPEADRLFHRDPRWLGADAAFSVDLGHERVLWLFGDTFVAASERCVRREAAMVRNSIAVQRGRDPSRAEITFHWGPESTSWLPADAGHWYWPLHGIRLPDGPLVLFWSRLHAVADGGFGFRTDGWIAVAIDDPDAAPDAWRPRVLPTPATPPGLVFAQGLVQYGGFVLGLAIREPGDHAGFAVRIAASALARGDLTTLELWHGRWSRCEPTTPLVPVLADAGPELSVHFDAEAEHFVHVRSLGFGATELALSTAREFTGPWSMPRALFRPPESDRARPLVYAGKAHPELLGADLVLTYAANSPDFAELVADATLYWPRFVRVDFERSPPD